MSRIELELVFASRQASTTRATLNKCGNLVFIYYSTGVVAGIYKVYECGVFFSNPLLTIPRVEDNVISAVISEDFSTIAVAALINGNVTITTYSVTCDFVARETATLVVPLLGSTHTYFVMSFVGCYLSIVYTLSAGTVLQLLSPLSLEVRESYVIPFPSVTPKMIGDEYIVVAGGTSLQIYSIECGLVAEMNTSAQINGIDVRASGDEALIVIAMNTPVVSAHPPNTYSKLLDQGTYAEGIEESVHRGLSELIMLKFRDCELTICKKVKTGLPCVSGVSFVPKTETLIVPTLMPSSSCAQLRQYIVGSSNPYEMSALAPSGVFLSFGGGMMIASGSSDAGINNILLFSVRK